VSATTGAGLCLRLIAIDRMGAAFPDLGHGGRRLPWWVVRDPVIDPEQALL
jgi:hypothetical protein